MLMHEVYSTENVNSVKYYSAAKLTAKHFPFSQTPKSVLMENSEVK